MSDEQEPAANAPAGWYPVDGDALRRWDGERWTDEFRRQGQVPEGPDLAENRKDRVARIAFGLIGLTYLAVPVLIGRLAPLSIVFGGAFVFFALGPVRRLREQLRFMGREVSPILLLVVAVALAVIFVSASNDL